MRRETVTFRLDAAKRAELDALAASQGRDRSFVINRAIESCLDAERRWLAQIDEGLRQAEAGEFASDEEVEAAYKSFGL